MIEISFERVRVTYGLETHLDVGLGSPRDEPVDPDGDFGRNRSRSDTHRRRCRLLSDRLTFLPRIRRLIHPHRDVLGTEKLSRSPCACPPSCGLLSRYDRSHRSSKGTGRRPRRPGQELHGQFPTGTTPRVLRVPSGLSQEIIRGHPP